MATRLPKRTIVIVGGGLTTALISRQLMAKGSTHILVLEHWDAQNLFVVGSSVYPHNSGYNPTGPLTALALRLGDDLASYTEKPRRP